MRQTHKKRVHDDEQKNCKHIRNTRKICVFISTDGRANDNKKTNDTHTHARGSRKQQNKSAGNTHRTHKTAVKVES